MVTSWFYFYLTIYIINVPAPQTFHQFFLLTSIHYYYDFLKTYIPKLLTLISSFSKFSSVFLYGTRADGTNFEAVSICTA